MAARTAMAPCSAVNISTGKETILHSFAGTDGAGPFAGLIKHQDTLYGTTQFALKGQRIVKAGTLFQLTP